MTSSYSQREQLDAFIRTSLFAFTWFVFDLLHPGDRFVPAWHVKAMVRALEEAMAGHIKRLLITIPPRHPQIDHGFGQSPGLLART
jgi:hypothetical protein